MINIQRLQATQSGSAFSARSCFAASFELSLVLAARTLWALVTVSRGIAPPAAVPEPCVRLSPHTAPRPAGRGHRHPDQAGLGRSAFEALRFSVPKAPA